MRKSGGRAWCGSALDDEHAPVPGQGDVIVNRKGRVVGSGDQRFAGHRWPADRDGFRRGAGQPSAAHRLGVYRLGGRNWEIRPLADLKPGDHLQLAEDITVIERFLNKR